MAVGSTPGCRQAAIGWWDCLGVVFGSWLFALRMNLGGFPAVTPSGRVRRDAASTCLARHHCLGELSKEQVLCHGSQ